MSVYITKLWLKIIRLLVCWFAEVRRYMWLQLVKWLESSIIHLSFLNGLFYHLILSLDLKVNHNSQAYILKPNKYQRPNTCTSCNLDPSSLCPVPSKLNNATYPSHACLHMVTYADTITCAPSHYKIWTPVLFLNKASRSILFFRHQIEL